MAGDVESMLLSGSVVNSGIPLTPAAKLTLVEKRPSLPPSVRACLHAAGSGVVSADKANAPEGMP